MGPGVWAAGAGSGGGGVGMCGERCRGAAFGAGTWLCAFGRLPCEARGEGCDARVL